MKLCTSHFALCAVSWFAIAVSWFVVLPVAVFRFYQLWVRRSTQILWVRRLHFDVVTIIGTLSCITVTSPLVLINACSDLLQGFKIWGLLNCIAVICTASSVAFKTILVHCDLTFAYINQQLSWKALIVSGDHNLSTSRYQTWRGTWLSPARLGLVAVAYSIVAIATLIWSVATDTHTFSLIALYFAFVDIVIALYAWMKTPRIADTFGIREEIKLLGVCILLTGVTFVAVFITMSFLDTTDKPLDIVLANLVTWLCAAYVLYLNTEFRWKQLDEKTREWDTRTAVRQTLELSKQSHDQIKRIRSVTTPSPSSDILDQPTVSDLINERLFRHSECVSLFAQFLIFEFSIENLIGCIEFFQLGQSLQTLHVDELPSATASKVLIQMNVDENCVPLSSINRMEESGAFARDWMAKFRQLCGKYIADDSSYRLNLHHRDFRRCFALRQRFDEVSANRALFTAETESELLQETIDVVFSIVSQCIHLIKDSFYRFRADDDFQRFLDVDIGRVHKQSQPVQ